MTVKRILVVDDERECCDLFRHYFVKRRCEVDTAYDGLKASELLGVHQYDYIFFDCNMPEISGIELIKVIQEKNPRARKIMVSGYGWMDEKFARSAGVDVFLRKPVDLKALENIVGAVGEGEV